jgi:hypothetical protein
VLAFQCRVLRWCDNGRGIDSAQIQQATSDIGHTYDQMQHRTTADLSRKGLGLKNACWRLFSNTLFFNKTRVTFGGKSFIVKTVGLLPMPKGASGDNYMDGSNVLIPWDIKGPTLALLQTAIWDMEVPARRNVVLDQLEALAEILQQDWMFSGGEDDRALQLLSILDNMSETGFCIYGNLKDPASLKLSADGTRIVCREGPDLQDAIPRWYMPFDCDVLDNKQPNLKVCGVRIQLQDQCF